MEVIAGPGSEKLATKTAKAAKFPLIRVRRRFFPDGEMYLRLDRRIRSRSVAVVHTLFPSNSSLLQLAFLADLAREQGARKIVAVCPYLAYSRQHMHYLPNDALSVRAVARIISAFADRAVVFDLHHPEAKRFFKIPVAHLSAARLLGAHGRRLRLARPFVLGADQERPGFYKAVAKEMGCDHGWLVKRRDRHTGRIKTYGKPHVRGKNVLLVDDIISSGHSIEEAAKICRRGGAASIDVAAVHGIFVQNALRRIRQAGVRRIATTDSVPSDISKISLAPMVAEALL